MVGILRKLVVSPLVVLGHAHRGAFLRLPPPRPLRTQGLSCPLFAHGRGVAPYGGTRTGHGFPTCTAGGCWCPQLVAVRHVRLARRVRFRLCSGPLPVP
eukprot:10943777-Alexandrium_andersonii.AAC.1